MIKVIWLKDLILLVVLYLIPTAVFEQIERNMARVEVLKTDAVWQGITYKEDKDAVVAGIKDLVDAGEYTSGLWN